MDLFKGIRPLDWTLAAVMVALAALLGFENVTAGPDADVAHALDSHSPLIIPVFVLAALPILWRRRNILAAIGASLVVVALSVPAFGWITRCGFALPLACAMAYAVARYAGGKGWQNHLVGLVGIFGLEVVTLIQDSSTGGLSGLVVGLPGAAILYGIGLFVQSRADRAPAGTTPVAERVHA